MYVCSMYVFLCLGLKLRPDVDVTDESTASSLCSSSLSCLEVLPVFAILKEDRWILVCFILVNSYAVITGL